MINPGNLANVLGQMYPTATPLVDFLVVEDAAGIRIDYWNTAKLGAQPTQAAIDAAEPTFDADAPKRASASKDQLIFNDLARQLRKAGFTPDMAFARLLYDNIKLHVASGSRSARETAFLTFVDTAVANNP